MTALSVMTLLTLVTATTASTRTKGLYPNRTSNRRLSRSRYIERRRKVHRLHREHNLGADFSERAGVIDKGRQTESIFEGSSSSVDEHLYVNAATGNDSKDGSSAAKAVKSLTKVLKLVKSKAPPTSGNLIVHMSGTFHMERLVVNKNHKGKSSTRRVIFRGDGDGSTRVTGGEPLDFVKVSSLSSNHPARKLAKLAPTSTSNLYAAAPPLSFPSSISSIRYPDKDCREYQSYKSPPTLSINRSRVLTRAREPNLPPATASGERDSMGEVRDTWLRTTGSNNQGKIEFASSDSGSVNLASDESWDGGGVMLHIFPIVDWFDARVPVGQRSSNHFVTSTSQKAPGDPNEGNKFKVANAARWYLEGAVEYLDTEGEYHVSGGENVAESAGWTLLYPPADVDVDSADFQATLSLKTSPIVAVEGSAMHVSFENIVFEGSRRYIAEVYASKVDFNKCSFVNAGHDAVEAYGQSLTFRDCLFEGSGGSSLQLSDDRDYDLLESKSALVDSTLSDFASTCRHYSEGIHLSGYGTIVSNNHFRSSNMAAIDVVGGGFRILHNVFSHVSDGSYDDGAIHWVAESPMERGTEVAYNVFFRNGVSAEPCNAETSCYQSDVYMDDMAGAMTIHGNVMIKDKVDQTKPPSNKYAVIHWVSIFINGGADIAVYENAFLGPQDGTSNGAIYKDKGVLFEQSCGGTLWPDNTSCGHTGICKNDPWYSLMRKMKWNKEPWRSAFPELKEYNANPAQGSNWRCANRRDCPMASWNITVLCNAGVGSNREMSNRAVWPSDSFSSLKDEATEGKTVPKRSKALTETGNKIHVSFNENVVAVDAIEKQGMAAVLMLAKRVAEAAQAEAPTCGEGTRNGAARSQLAGRGNNPCTNLWSFDGMASCDPCTGNIKCPPRDMPENEQCSCGEPTSPQPTSSDNNSEDEETEGPTSTSSSIDPTPAPTPKPCKDGKGTFMKNGKKRNCKWLSKRKKNVIKKMCKKKAIFCTKTCGTCGEDGGGDTPTPSPGNGEAYSIYSNRGYCQSSKDEQLSGKFTDGAKCWKKCKNTYNYFYAELTDKVCFCQKNCNCMEQDGESGTLAIVPVDFTLPSEC